MSCPCWSKGGGRLRDSLMAVSEQALPNTAAVIHQHLAAAFVNAMEPAAFPDMDGCDNTVGRSIFFHFEVVLLLHQNCQLENNVYNLYKIHMCHRCLYKIRMCHICFESSIYYITSSHTLSHTNTHTHTHTHSCMDIRARTHTHTHKHSCCHSPTLGRSFCQRHGTGCLP